MIAFLTGFLALVGWVSDIVWLADWDGNGIAMQPNTTLAAMATGLGLVLVPRRRGVATILGALAAGIGGATLFEHVTGVTLGIDTLILEKSWGTGATAAPGRMGPPASLSFLLLGTGLVLACRRQGGTARSVARWLGLAAATIAFLGFSGYLTGANQFYTIPRLSGIALQTAAILVMLGAGLAARVVERDPMRTLLEDSGAGALARRAFPFIVAIPLLLAWVLTMGRTRGHYDAGTATALLVEVLVLFLCVILWWGVRAVAARERSLEATRDRLRDADRRKDEFLAMLSHELRNPLTPITLSLEVMKLPGVDEGTVTHARATMERQVSHLVRLVDDLLDATRITRNRLELRRERVDVAEILRHAIDVARPGAEQAGHRIEVRVGAEPAWIQADPVRLAQVFGNLLHNALKYTPRGGVVTVALESRDDGVVATIRDTGIGIPPGMHARIFEMFVQANGTHESARSGLGIGLSLVKRIVELHGGEVSVTSGGADRGSTFTVRLPANG